MFNKDELSKLGRGLDYYIDRKKEELDDEQSNLNWLQDENCYEKDNPDYEEYVSDGIENVKYIQALIDDAYLLMNKIHMTMEKL